MIPQFEQFIKHPNYYKMQEDIDVTIYFRRETKNIHEIEDYIDAYTERKRLDRSNGGRGNKQEGNNFDSFMSGNRTDAGNDGIYQRGNETQRKNNGESDNQSRYDSNERKWRDFVDCFFEDGKQFYQDRLSTADKNRFEILENKNARLEKELADLEKAYESVQNYARAEGILIGQVEQGRTMAKEMCQKHATFDRKAKGYENAIAKKKFITDNKRAQMSTLSFFAAFYIYIDFIRKL